MAVTYQDKTETKVAADATSITCDVPAGFSAGDLLIAVIVKDDDNAMDTPAGWTLMTEGESDGRMRCNTFYRIAQVGDTNWTWNGDSENWIGWILRYTGHDAAAPIHASGDAVGETVNPTAPTVAYTDLAVGSIALQLFGADDDDTPYVTPGGLTERFNEVSSDDPLTYLSCGGAGGDKAVSGTGSTGTAVFTQDAGEEWVGVTIVIEAAGGAAAVAPTSIFYGPLCGPLGGPI